LAWAAFLLGPIIASMRAAIGLFAVILLLVGVFARGAMDDAVWGACLRVGLMMALWWFAFPQVKNVPRWLAVTGGAMLFVVLLRPKLVVLAIPVLIVLWLLRPRVPRGDLASRRKA
jgi:hypothetical protein